MLHLILLFLAIAVGASLLGFVKIASQFLLIAKILLGLFLVGLIIKGVRNYLNRKK
jgi:uncharacterized membrane protein YtjA (UPF0391 family)